MNTKRIGLVAAMILTCLNISPVFAQAGKSAHETTVVVPAEDAIKTRKEDDDGKQIIAIPPYIPAPPQRNGGSRTERPTIHIPE